MYCIIGTIICDFIEDLDCDNGVVAYQAPSEGKVHSPILLFIKTYLLIQEQSLICGAAAMLHKLTIELFWLVLHWKAITLRLPMHGTWQESLWRKSHPYYTLIVMVCMSAR